MQASQRGPFHRAGRLHSYTAYSIGCAIAWAVLWVVVLAVDPKPTIHKVAWVFGGWVIGWVSASIARVVYPPPKQRGTTGRSSFFRGLHGN